MAHPYASLRQSKVERSRVAGMCKGYADGGKVEGANFTNPKTEASKARKASGKVEGANFTDPKVEGAKAASRLDRYARGGAVKKASTNVNVIIAPQGGGAGGPGVLPPQPPPGPPPIPAMPPPGPPGMPPMQARGGRAYASGGAVKNGPAWAEGLKNGTPVMNSPGKNDGADIYRGRQITYARGGKAYPIEDGAGSGMGRLQKIGKNG